MCNNTDSRKFNSPTETGQIFQIQRLLCCGFGFLAFGCVFLRSETSLLLGWYQHLPRLGHLKVVRFSKLNLGTLGFPLNEPPPGTSHWIPAQGKRHRRASLDHLPPLVLYLPSCLQVVLIFKPRCHKDNSTDSYKFLKKKRDPRWLLVPELNSEGP